MNPKTISLRHFIFTLLLPFEQGGKLRRHVEESLNEGFEKYQFSPEDKRFGTYLIYGVLRNWFWLETIIRELSHIPLEKLEPAVRLLLRVGVFQLALMESVPDFAAVSSTLEIATTVGLSRKSRGYLNALLNTYIRQKKPFHIEPEKALPPWLLKRLKKQYDEATISLIVKAYQHIPTLSLRINTLKTDIASYGEKLAECNLPYEQSAEVSDVIFLTESVGDPRQLPGYEAGFFMVQDASSAKVSHFFNPQPGDQVLELGAAPGSKTTHMAALMQNQGKILAVDVSAKRMALLKENCQRLGVQNVEPLVLEGQSLACEDKLFDKVLIDAPCSGTGTIGKHPEIMLVLKAQDFSSYTSLQLGLLEKGFNCLKEGGILVYSTCSIDQDENQGVIQKFIEHYRDQAVLEAQTQILPSEKHDGFFMARILKANAISAEKD